MIFGKTAVDYSVQTEEGEACFILLAAALGKGAE